MPGRASTTIGGLLVAEQEPLGAYTTLQYDGNRNRTIRTDGRNWPTTYGYDALGRVVSMVYIDGTRNTFAFDAAGQQIGMRDGTGLSTFAYEAGRLSSMEYPISAPLTYMYDGAGNRTGLFPIGTD